MSRTRTRALLAAASALLVAAIVLVLVTWQADQTWVIRHSVELPEGWTVRSQSVGPRSSTSVVGGPRGALTPGEHEAGDFASCSVTVGRGLAVPRRGERVRFTGASGRWVAADPEHEDAPAGVFWRVGARTWADVSCGRSQAQDLALAERVHTGPEVISTPVRFVRRPQGYSAHAVGLGTGHPPGLSIVPQRVEAGRPDLLGYLGGLDELDAGDGERVQLGGRAATLWAGLHRVCFDAEPRLCVGEDVIDYVGDQGWPTGLRPLLLETLPYLDAAAAPGDQSTWFSGRRAFPD